MNWICRPDYEKLRLETIGRGLCEIIKKYDEQSISKIQEQDSKRCKRYIHQIMRIQAVGKKEANVRQSEGLVSFIYSFLSQFE